MKPLLYFITGIVLSANPLFAEPTKAASGRDLYLDNCASCHHPERYGVSGPPLIAETIGKRKDAELVETIKSGLPATNMPPFKASLKDEEIAAIVSYIKTPTASPKWEIKDILLTKSLSDKKGLSPRPAPDMTNLFMVVEGGKGDVHFMDGDTFAIIDKAHVGAIHGGPKFDVAMKNAYLGGRDGWIVKYDMTEWREFGRVRVGINTRNMALSPDGKLLVAANTLPENLVITDTDTLQPVGIIDTGLKPGAVYMLKGKDLFVLSFREKKEIWLLNPRTFSIEKLQTDQPFSDFFIDPSERYLIGTSREGKHLSIVDLEQKKVIKTIEGDGMRHLASAALFQDQGRTYAAFPHIEAPVLTVLELYKWEPKGSVSLRGTGFFARTHDNINDIWVDTGGDTIQIIDKRNLKVINEIVPAPGKKAMHIEFTKDGGHALVSIWENDGAVVIYDTKTLKEVKRLPFVKPVGKYNATNKKY